MKQSNGDSSAFHSCFIAGKPFGPDEESGAWKGSDLPEITWFSYEGIAGALSRAPSPLCHFDSSLSPGGGSGGLCVVELMAGPASRSE